ncbi:hypothetical protein CISG_10084 [Coccidioides immitis RMSCC 3703]|uniref:Uncharacterized protein n=1 Tax=Coccidioides immitis RMSCC 3703 TaxID=454286 RepID=A0A0J8QLQ4_COCIT|nr:hypothetical protein CISG_10084 [Coccidioides immitis RMSCC 3703]
MGLEKLETVLYLKFSGSSKNNGRSIKNILRTAVCYVYRMTVPYQSSTSTGQLIRVELIDVESQKVGKELDNYLSKVGTERNQQVRHGWWLLHVVHPVPDGHGAVIYLNARVCTPYGEFAEVVYSMVTGLSRLDAALKTRDKKIIF